MQIEEHVIRSGPYRLKTGGINTPERLLVAGKYSSFDREITRGNFSVHLASEEECFDVAWIIKFNRNPTAFEVMEEFKIQQFLQPRIEHAFAFGAQFHDEVMMPIEGRNGPIIFLHEPWLSPVGNQGILTLTGWEACPHFKALKTLEFEWVNLPHNPVVKPPKDISLDDGFGHGWRNSSNRWQASLGCRFLGIDPK